MAAPMKTHASGKLKNKMGETKRKRTLSDSDDKDVQSKQQKTDLHDTNLSVEEFKVLIKDKSTTVSALAKFVEQAKEHEENTSTYNIVELYCKSSPECQEVLQLISQEPKKTESLASHIFLCLETILLYIRAHEDATLKATTAAAIRRSILTLHLPCVYWLLSTHHKSSHIKAGLRLLTAIAIEDENGDAAQEVLNAVDWGYKVWTPLLSRTDIRDPKDVRNSYLMLLMSLLTNENVMVAKQLVETKGLLNPIFVHMKSDKASTIRLVLPVLLTQVVQNPSISKTSKIRLFTDRALKELAQLYIWTGPKAFKRPVKGKRNKQEVTKTIEELVQEEETEEQAEIRDMVHKFLLELCCDFKTGINFRDDSLGTSGKNRNHYLSALLLSLEKPGMRRSRVRELVVRVLAACPDLLPYYLPALATSLKPRDTVTWGKYMDLLKEIYSGQPSTLPAFPVGEAGEKSSEADVSELLALATETALPPKSVWEQLTQAVLKPSSTSVCRRGLDVMIVILKRIHKSMAHLHPSHREFRDDFRSNLTELLPSVQKLMALWKESCKSEEQKPELADNALPYTPPSALQEPLLHLLCLYQNLVSEKEHRDVDYPSLVEGLADHGANDDGASHGAGSLRLHMLTLLASSELDQSQWLKQNSDGHSTLYLLLKMVYTAPQGSSLQDTIVKLLHKLIADTGYFEDTRTELLLWLRGLASATETDEQAAILDFLYGCVSAVLKDPYKYMDRVEELLDEVRGTEDEEEEESAGRRATEEEIEAWIQSTIAMDCEEICQLNEKPITADDSERYIQPFSPLVSYTLDSLSSTTSITPTVRRYVERSLLGAVRLQRLRTSELRASCRVLARYGVGARDAIVRAWAGPETTEAGAKKKTTPKKKTAVSTTDIDPISTELDQILLSKSKGEGYKWREISVEQTPLEAQKVLLYMTTAVEMTMKEKNKENLYDKLTCFFGILNQLVQNVSKKGQQETEKTDNAMETETEETKTDDFQTLSFPAPQPSVVLSDVLDLILKHPLTAKYFLGQTDQAKDQKMTKFTSRVFTTFLANILSPHASHEKVGGFLTQHLAKFQTELDQSLLKLNTGSKSDFSEELVAVSSMMLNVMDEASVKILSGKMFGLDVSFDGTETGVTRFICSILKKFSDPDMLQFCSSTQFANVAYRISVGSDAALTQELLSLLERKPLLLVSLDRRFLGDEVRTTPGGSRVVELLVASCHVARTWYEEASDAWIENRKVTLAYLTHAHEVPKNTLKAIRKTYQKKIVEALNDLPENKKYATSEKTDLLLAIQKHSTQKGKEKTLQEIKELLSDNVTSKSSITRKLFSTYIALYNLTYPSNTKEATTTTDSTTTKDASESATKSENQDEQPSSDSGISPTVPDSATRRRHGSLLLRVLECVQAQNKGRVVEEAWLSVEAVAEEILRVTEVKEDLGSEEVDVQALWTKVLRFKLRVPVCVRLLSHLACLPPVSQLPTLYAMLLSHSAFLGALLGGKDQELKDAIVVLLHTLVHLNPECCEKGHLTILLGAYGATLSLTDQRLKSVFRVYELEDCCSPHHEPYLWGAAATEHYAALARLPPSLTSQPSMERLLDPLAPARLWASAMALPLTRAAGGGVQGELKGGRMTARFLAAGRRWEEQQGGEEEEGEELEEAEEDGAWGYDPAFLLLLFYKLLAPERRVRLRVFVERGCLAYTLCCLSLHDPLLRCLAYAVLARLRQHSHMARYPAKQEIEAMLEILDDSLEYDNQKLPCVFTIFLAKLSKIISDPHHDLYILLNEWVQLKPTMDLANVPEYYKMFNSYSPQWYTERKWILQSLVDGMSETGDYRVYEKRYVFRDLLTFYACQLSDKASKIQVLQMLRRAVAHRTVAQTLVKDSFCQWLSLMIRNFPLALIPMCTLCGSVVFDLSPLNTLHEINAGVVSSEHTPQEAHPLLLAIFVELYWTMKQSRSTMNIIFLSLMNLLSLNFIGAFSRVPALGSLVACMASIVTTQQQTKDYHAANSGANVDMIGFHLSDVCHLLCHYFAYGDGTKEKSKLQRSLEKEIVESNGKRIEPTKPFKSDAELGIVNGDEVSVSDLLTIIAHSNIQECKGFYPMLEAVFGWSLLMLNTQKSLDDAVKVKVVDWLKKCLIAETDFFVSKSQRTNLWLQLLGNLYFTSNSVVLHESVNLPLMVFADAFKTSQDESPVVQFVKQEGLEKRVKDFEQLPKEKVSIELSRLLQEMVLASQ